MGYFMRYVVTHPNETTLDLIETALKQASSLYSIQRSEGEYGQLNHNTMMKNSTGSFLYGYTTLNGAVVSGTTTLATITWKFLVSPGTTTQHFVLATVSPKLGTMLLDTGLNQIVYTATDGSLTILSSRPCPLGPAP